VVDEPDNSYKADQIKIGQQQTPVGVVWYMTDIHGDKHWFSTRELTVKYAAKYRYDLMTGQVQ